MKRIKMLRSTPADKINGGTAYREGQVVTVDDLTADKLIKRSRPLAVLVVDVKPHTPAELVAAIEQPKPIEPAKPQAKPSKR